jgi:hypothetical protein
VVAAPPFNPDSKSPKATALTIATGPVALCELINFLDLVHARLVLSVDYILDELG